MTDETKRIATNVEMGLLPPGALESYGKAYGEKFEPFAGTHLAAHIAGLRAVIQTVLPTDQHGVAGGEAGLREALKKARLWVEHATAPIRDLSPVAAQPGEQMLREIDAALAVPSPPAEMAGVEEDLKAEKVLLVSLNTGYCSAPAKFVERDDRINEIDRMLAALRTRQDTRAGGAVEKIREKLEVIAHVADFPEHKRSDAEFLRGAIMCARDYARAALADLPTTPTGADDGEGAKCPYPHRYDSGNCCGDLRACNSRTRP